MWEAEFFQDFDLVAAAASDRARGPFTHSVYRKYRGFLERGRIESAHGVRLMVLGKQYLAVLAERGQFIANRFAQIQFFGQPTRKHSRKGREASRCDCQIRFQQTRELCDWFVIENHR